MTRGSTVRYEVPINGAKVVLDIRDPAGNCWSVGAILGDRAYCDEGGEIGVVEVPSSDVIRGNPLAIHIVQEFNHGQ